MAPGDVVKQEYLQAKLVEAFKKLTKFNIWVEAIVEYNDNGYLVMRDTQLIDIWKKILLSLTLIV